MNHNLLTDASLSRPRWGTRPLPPLLFALLVPLGAAAQAPSGAPPGMPPPTGAAAAGLPPMPPMPPLPVLPGMPPLPAMPGMPSPPPRAAGKPVSFLACPIYRDAARQCWMAEHGGRWYYIGRTGLSSSPQLLHKVLIEGELREGESSCGATVIEPVQVSVMPELDHTCNTVLPDNGDKPSEPGLFDMPAEMMQAIGKERPLPPFPRQDTAFSVRYDFGSLTLNQSSQAVLEMAAKFALANQARRLVVTGHAAQSLLSNGRLLTEDPSLAAQRAQAVGKALAMLGLPTQRVTIGWAAAVAQGDGIDDAARREVRVQVELPTP